MFSISKRPTVARTPTRSEQVRALWVDFEVWHASQLREIENKLKLALKDLEQKWRTTKSRRPKKDSKELEEEKTKTRLALENTLDGNAIRQEWDRRLRDAGLVSEDWVDMTDEEQRKVETILGADLEFEEDQQPRSSESYAIVDPSSFHSLDDAWLEVTLRSHDQLSLDASTSSASSTSEAWNTPAYALWSSEASRSSAQSSQTSSPDWHSSKHLASDLSSASSSRPSTSTSMSSHTRSKPHGLYIGPHLTSDTDDEETSFEKWKLNLRIQKIREFHDDAADADVQLTLDLDDARRTRTWTKEDEAQLLRAHETDMLALRELKEAERKAAVETERQRRRAELRQQLPTERESNTKAQKFLKSLQPDRDSPSVSDTPTIRQSTFFRTREQSLSHLQQQEWPESGNDTPTPTARNSAWNFKNENSSFMSGGTVSAFGAAPPLKRLATAPASVTSTSGLHSQLSQSLTTAAENASTSAPKTAARSTAESIAQLSMTSIPKADTSVTVLSSSKKSKKEKEKEKEKEREKEKEQAKAKTAKKPNSSTVERKERNDETSLMGASMPGQWGWGGPIVASSTSVPPAVTGKPSSTSTISFLSSNPSTSSIATVPSSSSHSSPYSHPSSASSTFNNSLPAHSLSAPPISLPTVASTAQVHASQAHALPDNRRVWFPPGALESNLNNKTTKVKQPNQNMLEVPAPIPAVQIQKAASGPGNVANSTNSTVGNGTLGVPVQIKKSVSGPPDLSSKIESTPFPVTAAAPASARGQGGQSKDSREAHGAKSESSTSTSKATNTSVPPTKPATGDQSKDNREAHGAKSESSSSTSKATNTSVPPTKSATVQSAPIVSAPQLSSSSSNTSTSSKKKSKGKKKVTIEEAQDEEAGSGPNLLEGKGIERLPVDSRYIIEPISELEAPKPVVSEPQAQEMYKEIFGYKVPDAPSISASASTSSVTSDDLNQRNGYNFWTPSAASTALSSSSSLPLNNDHERWIPSGGTDQSSTSSFSSLSLPPNEHERWIPSAGAHESTARQDKQKTVRWMPSAYAYDAPSVPEQEQPDFLSMLNSLEAIVTGGDAGNLPSEQSTAIEGAGKRESNKKGRGRSESNTDETFWQHAMASLGRGGSSIPAPSAM